MEDLAVAMVGSEAGRAAASEVGWEA